MKNKVYRLLVLALIPLACTALGPSLQASSFSTATESLETLSDRVEANPSDPAARYRLGLALYQQGDYEEALRHWCAVVHDRRNCLDVYVRIAMTHFRLGEFARAEKVFLYVLARDEKNRHARKGLARLRAERMAADDMGNEAARAAASGHGPSQEG